MTAALRTGPGRCMLAALVAMVLIYAPELLLLLPVAAAVRLSGRTPAGRWTLARVSPARAMAYATLAVLALVGIYGQGPDVTLVMVHPPAGQMAEAGR